MWLDPEDIIDNPYGYDLPDPYLVPQSQILSGGRYNNFELELLRASQYPPSS
jgi:hypothetical protein